MSSGFAHESQAAKSIEWYTPPWIFNAIGLTWDYDVCAPEGGVPWIPAARHYHKGQDGLAAPWHGRVWCNPPYGKETPKWLARMAAHNEGMALVFARTDCAWFHDYVTTAAAILFLKGRVRFVDGAGATGGSGAGSGSMLVAWGVDCAKALEWMALMDLGFLYARGDV